MGRTCAQLAGTSRPVLEEIRVGKTLCVLFCIFYVLVAAIVSRRWLTILLVLFTVTSVYLFFFIWCTWCDCKDSSIPAARLKYLENVTFFCGLFMLWGTSEYRDTILRQALTSCVLPVAVMVDAVSMQRAYGFACAHVAMCMFSCSAEFRELYDTGEVGEGLQWLLCTVAVYSHLNHSTSRTLAVIENTRVLDSVCDVFEKCLGFMCDGYVLLDAQGYIIGMDQKARSIFTWSGQAKTSFDSLLHPKSADMVGVLEPGLRKMWLVPRDGGCVEAESYTCFCALPRQALPLIVGQGGHHHREETWGARSTEHFCLRALRITAQCADQGPIGAASGTDASTALPGELQRFRKVPETEAGSSVDCSSLMASSAGGVPRHLISQQLNDVLNILHEPPSEVWSACRDVASLRAHLSNIESVLKESVRDVLSQAQEQIMQAFRQSCDSADDDLEEKDEVSGSDEIGTTA